MELTIETTFNQQARMSLKIIGKDVTGMEQREEYKAQVKHFYDLQTALIKQRTEAMKESGHEPRKPGRPKKDRTTGGPPT